PPAPRADPTPVAARLESLLGAGAVTTAGCEAWATDGVVPRAVVLPADADQVAAVLRVCDQAGAAVVPWGGGTAMTLGYPPARADVVLRTERLDAIIDHDPSNLTVTVGAGIALRRLQEVLGAHGQWLPLEPPLAERATAGGAVASGLGGPRRLAYGSARDLVIGARAALAQGTVVACGGKTVKNVAGYDLGKLVVGSLGTLGVLTELTFRLIPRPESSRTLAAWASDMAAVAALARRVFDSALTPVAVVGVNAHAAARAGRGAAGLLVRSEGVEPAVRRHERDIGAWAAAVGMETEAFEGEAETALWKVVRDVGWWEDTGVALRASVPPGAAADLAVALARALPEGTAMVVHPGVGTLWLEAPAADAAVLIALLRPLVERAAGHLLLARAPAALKAAHEVWTPGPQARALALMREVKRAFDPRGTLSPGRFVSRL
ncbi:MAG: FAD-binding oxidoreductase, partial [Armatimonadota bacterium]|nr:FAD-binding oxidoreductase [Armatimonadota bacterium]